MILPFRFDPTTQLTQLTTGSIATLERATSGATARRCERIYHTERVARTAEAQSRAIERRGRARPRAPGIEPIFHHNSQEYVSSGSVGSCVYFHWRYV